MQNGPVKALTFALTMLFVPRLSPVFATEPQLLTRVTPDAEWNAVFDRTDGWTGADSRVPSISATAGRSGCSATLGLAKSATESACRAQRWSTIRLPYIRLIRRLPGVPPMPAVCNSFGD